MKKLSSYLTAGIAATATFQSSDAATVVTLYGLGARDPFTDPVTPYGISMGLYSGYNSLRIKGPASFFAVSSGSEYFTRGTDLSSPIGDSPGIAGSYHSTKSNTFILGAQSGSENYVNISFDGDDGVYEAVGQFNLDGLRTGYLVALARNNDNTALSISQGKTAIDAVPEPSAIALLALGAGGMAMRRRRKVA